MSKIMNIEPIIDTIKIAIDIIDKGKLVTKGRDELEEVLKLLESAPEVPNTTSGDKAQLSDEETTFDTISRQAAIKKILGQPPELHYPSWYAEQIKELPPAQPEPLSDAYMNAVWAWLIDYQIKAAELKGRYTPYEVLSWVANDWRKEHERSD